MQNVYSTGGDSWRILFFHSSHSPLLLQCCEALHLAIPRSEKDDVVLLTTIPQIRYLQPSSASTLVATIQFCKHHAIILVPHAPRAINTAIATRETQTHRPSQERSRVSDHARLIQTVTGEELRTKHENEERISGPASMQRNLQPDRLMQPRLPSWHALLKKMMEMMKKVTKNKRVTMKQVC